MAKRAVDKAVIRCSCGTAASALSVKNDHSRIIENKNVANVSDHIPLENILPFGLCKSMANPAVKAALGVPQPCEPGTPQNWQQQNDRIILDSEKALDDQCVCLCLWKGVITILDAGQNSHFTG